MWNFECLADRELAQVLRIGTGRLGEIDRFVVKGMNSTPLGKAKQDRAREIQVTWQRCARDTAVTEVIARICGVGGMD